MFPFLCSLVRLYRENKCFPSSLTTKKRSLVLNQILDIRFGMYPRDNIAQKDCFTHLFLQPLQYFCAQIPRELFGGESQGIFEFEPINRLLLQRYPLFQCLLIPIILIQTSRERHYFVSRKPLSGRYSHSLFSWPAKYHPWPKQTNLQWCFKRSPTWGSFWDGP